VTKAQYKTRRVMFNFCSMGTACLYKFLSILAEPRLLSGVRENSKQLTLRGFFCPFFN